jgi:orotate phosphoribosyltransferase
MCKGAGNIFIARNIMAKKKVKYRQEPCPECKGESFMTSNDGKKALETLQRTNAIRRNGHFVYTPKEGKYEHGPDYIDKDRLLLWPLVTEEFCIQFSRAFNNSSHVEAIIGPGVNGGKLAILTALRFYNCINGRNMPSMQYEKINGTNTWKIRDAFKETIRGKNVLIVDDILNSGGTVKEGVKLVAEHGGRVAGIGVMVNRGTATAESLQVPKLFSVVTMPLPMYPWELCPLCRQGTPINQDIGHGKEFLAYKESL